MGARREDQQRRAGQDLPKRYRFVVQLIADELPGVVGLPLLQEEQDHPAPRAERAGGGVGDSIQVDVKLCLRHTISEYCRSPGQVSGSWSSQSFTAPVSAFPRSMLMSAIDTCRQRLLPIKRTSLYLDKTSHAWDAL